MSSNSATEAADGSSYPNDYAEQLFKATLLAFQPSQGHDKRTKLALLHQPLSKTSSVDEGLSQSESATLFLVALFEEVRPPLCLSRAQAAQNPPRQCARIASSQAFSPTSTFVATSPSSQESTSTLIGSSGMVPYKRRAV